MKRCPKCKEVKPLACFGRRDGVRSGEPRSYCKQCQAMMGRARNRTSHGRFVMAGLIAKRCGNEFAISLVNYTTMTSRPCRYCGTTLHETGVGLDRINNKKGYVTGNVVPCCDVCNRIKSNVFTFDEMLRIGAVIARIRAGRNGVAPKSNYGRGRKRKYA